MRRMNLALMEKLGWRLCKKENSLWSQIVGRNYSRGKVTPEGLVKKHSSSNAWKGMVEAANIIRKVIRATVYNGNKAFFWRESWLGDTPLMDLTLKPLPLVVSFRLVRDYWEAGRGWKWEKITGVLPQQARIMNKMLRQDNDREDSFCWGLTSDGSFTVKTAYNLVSPCLQQHRSHLWEKVWKLQVPQGVKTLMWAIMHWRIMTNMERCRRGLTLDPHCKCCPGVPEDLDHLFRQCLWTELLWKQLLTEESQVISRRVPFKAW